MGAWPASKRPPEHARTAAGITVDIAEMPGRGFACKLVQEAEKSWQRIRGIERLAGLLTGMVFQGGVPTPDNPSERQRMAA